MEHKLSAIIPCKDERKNIRHCIESLQTVVDEVLVADSGSTDGTLDIVRSIEGCRLIQREYGHYGDFVNWAIPQAHHSWILLVDADERVTPALAAEITSLLRDGPMEDGYYFLRDNHFMGHPIRFGSWRTDKVLRLFRRDLARYQGPSDHGEATISSGRVGNLGGKLTHYTCWSWEQHMRKIQRYASLQAQQWHVAGKKASALKLATRGPARFIRDYFLKGGFLDGLPGLQIAICESYYAFLKQANLWQLCRGMSQPDPEAERTISRKSTLISGEKDAA